MNEQAVDDVTEIVDEDHSAGLIAGIDEDVSNGAVWIEKDVPPIRVIHALGIAIGVVSDSLDAHEQDVVNEALRVAVEQREEIEEARDDGR